MAQRNANKASCRLIGWMEPRAELPASCSGCFCWLAHLRLVLGAPAPPDDCLTSLTGCLGCLPALPCLPAPPAAAG